MIAHHETDWRCVVEMLLGPQPPGTRIFYQKQMSHHLLPDIGREWLSRVTNAFLIRDPRAMLASLAEKLEEFTLADTGLPQQVEIFDHVLATTGRVPPVVDSADLLAAPEPVLRRLCEALEVPFSERMLCLAARPARHRRDLGAMVVRTRRGVDGFRDTTCEAARKTPGGASRDRGAMPAPV